MARQESAGKIINDTALEVGIVPVSDPYSTQDEAFTQLRGLLNSAGRELVGMFAWEVLQKKLSITTAPLDTGIYSLPSDFDRMIDQSAWNITSRIPIAGPLSPQNWAAATSLPISPTTYVVFRLSNNTLEIFPNTPVPEPMLLNWWYISRNWVETMSETADQASASSDIIMYDPSLIVKFLKVKYLSAKGYDIAVTAREFDMTFMNMTGQDKGAVILSASRRGSFPYLGSRNIPFTGFG